MSGHSKWSQIKRQKGAADVKRGAAFSKLTNAVILAAKKGADPDSNFSLKMAIEKARSANMPKENIERAIKRGTGELAGAVMEEAIYEAIGPNNIGVIIEVATDNKNRTNSEIKQVLNQFGGKIAGPGAVKYQFRRLGKLLVKKSDDQEAQELALIEAGAEDFVEEDDMITCYTKPNELEQVKKALENQAMVVEEASLIWEPDNLVKIEDMVVAEKILKTMESLEELGDVVAVYSNFDIPEKY